MLQVLPPVAAARLWVQGCLAERRPGSPHGERRCRPHLQHRCTMSQLLCLHGCPLPFTTDPMDTSAWIVQARGACQLMARRAALSALGATLTPGWASQTMRPPHPRRGTRLTG